MENLAYLHLAFAYEDETPCELVSLSYLLQTTAAPNWKRLSSRAWSYMLPLALTVSILGAVGSALALERGDQGPSVRNLQQQLQKAGFLQAPITQVFDFPTEDAVRRFQKTAGLPVDGIAGTTTVQKLQGWRERAIATQPKKPLVVSTQTTQTTQATTTQNRRTTQSTTEKTAVTNKRRDPNFLGRGDEGEEVRILQERLRVAGFYYNNSTGIFGSITEDSVKRFQTAYNLDADGIVGPATLQKLPPLGVGFGNEEVPKRSNNDDKMRLGDRGESVRILQSQLIKAGYLEGEPNGYYGPYTADAVRRFQADNYLKASGIAGPTTRAKLHDLVNATSRSEFNVLEIQRRLNARGFYKGQLNGVMGNDTKDAIKQAQEFYGISLTDIRSGRF
jgi:peptidoglycan hydrolase-like protein with peptidoglycan-binding domain